MNKEDITPSYLDQNTVQKMINDSVAAAIPRVISNALTIANSSKNLNNNSKVWHIDSSASNNMI